MHPRQERYLDPRPVLVTGGSGFVAGHCILRLLAAGHAVRATLRSPDREAAARAALVDAGMAADAPIAFVPADLLRDEGWAAAMAGVVRVLHVASPVMPGHVKDEDDVIVPAREGTLHVLRAVRDAGVRRVVLTSAFHAVSWGHPKDEHVFTEADWTIVDGPGVDAYGKSKTLAERAAWAFVEGGKGAMELVTLLPVAVMGPVIGQAVSGANHLIERLMNGSMPRLPDLYVPIVDVRDVADAHLAALAHPSAAGERFLLSNGAPLAMRDIAAVLKDELGTDARRVSLRGIPDIVLRCLAPFNPQVRSIVRDLGHAKRSSNEKARRILDWTPRDPREAIVAAARTMVAKGLVKAA